MALERKRFYGLVQGVGDGGSGGDTPEEGEGYPRSAGGQLVVPLEMPLSWGRSVFCDCAQTHPFRPPTKHRPETCKITRLLNSFY